ncbi:MAG TPA: tartrate dehydrogenase [Limnobacter sp.]|nr:tartrate dehydrogenase [Limnobacter sp.]
MIELNRGPAVKHSIAIIPGDGIGQEIMPEALKVLAWAEKTHGIELELHHKDWAHCNYYLQHGSMMPGDWKPQLEACEAILFGAVGMPHLVPDHVSLWGSLLRYRREFDQYVNLRPVKLLPGAPCPLANRQPGDIDFVVVRENTEGEYSAVGGRMFEGTEREIVLQESIFTRHGVDRVLKFAFELAQSRPRRKLTAATKSNGIAISMPYWDERVDNMASHYPEVACDKQHVDILAARFVMQPERFDVVVASNLFGDILSDLGPACTGTIGLAPSANLNPERRFPSLFEPVHGSAPDIAGQGIANPIAMIWSAALMIQFLGGSPAVVAEGRQAAYQHAHDSILAAIETVLARGNNLELTPDLKGKGSTRSVGDAILAALG